MTEHLSLTGRSWHIRHTTDRLTADALVTLLAADRGIDTEHAPPLPPVEIFPEMHCAAQRIRHAIRQKEHVAIFGDYDCDGITAAALVARCLHRHALNPTIRLPHRVRDGYGLKTETALVLADAGVSLVITVDTGVSAHDAIALLKERGIDVIVTDHHHCHTRPEHAYAVIHPALAPEHPIPHPSGAGVAFQLVRAVESTDTWNGIAEDLALATIGTVADLVPLTGCNRTLVAKGLRALHGIRTGPLHALVASATIEGYPRSSDIAFRIAPRINAAGRLEDPLLALRALLEGGPHIEELNLLNADRQRTTQELCALAEEHIDTTQPILTLADERLHPGIVGLIAGRLTERYGRPTMIAAIEGTVCTASLRSIPAYHIARGLDACEDLLVSHGGHAQAAGCTVHRDRFAEVARRLAEDIRSTVAPQFLRPSLGIDAQIDVRDITTAYCRTLQTLEPFGNGNDEPRFLLSNVHLEQLRRVGMEGTHLQCRIAGIKCIGFGLGSQISSLSDAPMDIAVRLGIDTWKDREEPQIFLEDVRTAVPQSVGATMCSIA